MASAASFPRHDIAALAAGVSGLTHDSRAVAPGCLFAAFPGVKSDGRQYIPAALAAGASFILAPEGTSLPPGASAALITDPNPRRLFALVAAAFYGAQPAHVAAVTGTNGKTSVAVFTAQIWEALGYKAACLGTLGLRAPGLVRSGSMTTPDAAALHAALADLHAAGVTHLALEASSHGLDQYRLDGVRISVAGFTNLSHDHLDYHADMAEYLAAKARLFTEILPPDGVAVLNADVPEFAELSALCRNRGIRVLSYGQGGADLKILSRTPRGAGQDLALEVFGTRHEIVLPLVGAFQAMNALCAAAMVLAENPGRESEIIGALAKLEGAPGRLQSVSGHPKGASVFVDYAHTPDALENVLSAVRPHTKGRLVCVFGCGGDRDTAKRPAMGRIAAQRADTVIVTDDNPRGEDPAHIRKQILEGASGALEVPDRREAIARAVGLLGPGDALVVAGKGHEQGQVFKDRTEPFDDVSEVLSAIRILAERISA